MELRSESEKVRAMDDLERACIADSPEGKYATGTTPMCRVCGANVKGSGSTHESWCNVRRVREWLLGGDPQEAGDARTE